MIENNNWYLGNRHNRVKRSTSTVKDWLQITALNIKSIFQPRPDPAQDRLINLFAQSRRRPRLINSVNSRDNLLNGKILCWYWYTYIYTSSTWYLVNYCIVDSRNLSIWCNDVNNNMSFWSQSLFFRAVVKYTVCRLVFVPFIINFECAVLWEMIMMMLECPR